MCDVDHDDLVVFVGSVLSNPVGVEDSETVNALSASVFSNSAEVSSGCDSDTLVDGFTVDDTLVHSFLSSTSSDSNSVDHITLLSFISKSSGFIRSGWSLTSVDMW